MFYVFLPLFLLELPLADNVFLRHHSQTAPFKWEACATEHYDNKNHNASRVTSAGSSEELAESHVNKTTQLANEDSESPRADSEGAIQAPYQPPTVYPT
jgi:hypothetical protein